MSALTALYVKYIISGDKTYAQVPRMLKPQVAESLRELDMEHLITEE